MAVLLIDDEVSSEDPLLQLLRLEGVQVTCAGSGRAGLALAVTRAHDAIILDLRLPDMSGVAVLNALVDHAVTAPVVIVTGYGLEPNIEDVVLRAGAAAFRQKPVSDELVMLLRSLVVRPPGGTIDGSKPPQVLATSSLRAHDDLDHILKMLRRMLRRRFSSTPEHLLNDAEDALLSVLDRPYDFDAARGSSLIAFLFPAAARNVQNLLQREARRRAREAAFVADRCSLEYVDPISVIERRERLKQLHSCLNSVLADHRERRAFLRWLTGDRATPSLADALGLSGLPITERRREVKRFKDRILKRLLRAWHTVQPNSN